ncbi:helix-turn-helix domain-containing protein [Nonomuraea jiangxiensis]|uniref:helix-turn-helix domain-containing protein n=1 Tax=Nonomuraea jiangxiensis TaxID=633440 RepID=UPI001C40A2E8|nr:helix-turn-helix domain-containing protein [Nonomuraea jiangxiensis]
MTAEDLSVPAAELTIVGHYDKAPGYATRRPGGSPSWLLLWTEAGAGYVAQGEASFEVRAGDLAVLGSGVAQHYRVLPGARRWRFWWVHFQPRPAWLAWLAPHARSHGCHLVAGVPATVHERIDLAFERALQDAHWVPGAAPTEVRGAGEGRAATTAEVRGVEGGRVVKYAEVRGAWEGRVAGAAEVRVPAVVVEGPARELVLGAVEEVLVLATASVRPEGRSDEGDERIRRVLAIIAAEPGAAHSVASLAAAVALSPSRFAHLFAAETGRPPMQAVRQARVRHAAGLLEVTDLDIGQVAAASGFVSPFHFSRAFRREYGLPPRDYRARLRAHS